MLNFFRSHIERPFFNSWQRTNLMTTVIGAGTYIGYSVAGVIPSEDLDFYNSNLVKNSAVIASLFESFRIARLNINQNEKQNRVVGAFISLLSYYLFPLILNVKDTSPLNYIFYLGLSTFIFGVYLDVMDHTPGHIQYLLSLVNQTRPMPAEQEIQVDGNRNDGTHLERQDEESRQSMRHG